jgi:hypothetical protein
MSSPLRRQLERIKNREQDFVVTPLSFKSGNGRLIGSREEKGDGGEVCITARLSLICAGDARRGIVFC